MRQSSGARQMLQLLYGTLAAMHVQAATSLRVGVVPGHARAIRPGRPPRGIARQLVVERNGPIFRFSTRASASR